MLLWCAVIMQFHSFHGKPRSVLHGRLSILDRSISRRAKTDKALNKAPPVDGGDQNVKSKIWNLQRLFITSDWCKETIRPAMLSREKTIDVLHGTPGGKLTGCARSKIKRVKLFGSSSIPGVSGRQFRQCFQDIQQTLQDNVCRAVWILHIWNGGHESSY